MPQAKRNTLALAALLSLPLILPACDRDAGRSPSATAPSQERQALEGTSPERTLRDNPPAAGPGSSTMPGDSGSMMTPGASPPPSDSSTTAPAEPGVSGGATTSPPGASDSSPSGRSE